jgi:phosphatidylglycerophosphate synthase
VSKSKDRIRQAVVVARGDQVLEPVAGVPLLKRTILTLGRAGITKIVVVGRPLAEDAAYAAAGLTVEHVASEASSDGAAVLAARDKIAGPFVLAIADRVFDPALARTAAESGLGDADVLRCGGLFAASPALFIALAGGGGSLDDALAALTAAGRVRTVEVGDVFWQIVDSPAARKAAQERMLLALTKPTDGVVARHLNRRVSRQVTRVLLGTSVTPNQITVIAGAIGFLGIWLVSRATWNNVLIGAVLVQAQSILDGCDGELARLKFKGSKVGEWLDNVLDDTMNIVYGLALGEAAAVLFDQPLYRWLGVVTAAGYVINNAVLYVHLWRHHRSGNPFLFRWWFQKDDAYLQQELAGASLASRLMGLVHGMGRRDLFLFAFMLLCAIRLPHVAVIWYAAVAVVGGAMAIMHVLGGGLTVRAKRAA